MKRFLHAGEGYVLFKRPSFKAIPCSSDTTLTDNKRYRNKTTSKAYGLLVRPWFRQAAGILLVALVCLSARTGRAISRLLTGNSSALSRSLFEAESKPTRRIVEAESNNCRRTVEQVSNKPRRNRVSCNLYCLSTLVIFFCLMVGNNQIAAQESESSYVVQPLRFGDTIPDSFWDLPLKVVNHPEGKDSIRLKDYIHNRLIVLDFWASWCAPCVISVEKWESKLDSLPEMAFFGVHYDYDYKALPFIQRKAWRSPHVIGDQMKLLNSFFFMEPRITRSIWILDGVFVAVTDHNGPDVATIKEVIYQNKTISSRMEDTYMLGGLQSDSKGGGR